MNSKNTSRLQKKSEKPNCPRIKTNPRYLLFWPVLSPVVALIHLIRVIPLILLSHRKTCGCSSNAMDKKDFQNIARVQNCLDITIVNSPFGLFCVFVYHSDQMSKGSSSSKGISFVSTTTKVGTEWVGTMS